VSAPRQTGRQRPAARRGEPGGQPRELVVEDGEGGVVQVVADQAEVQVPALWAAVGALGPGRDDAGVHGEMMPSASSRSRQVRTVRSDSPV
jgi:hypothetical protein